MILGAMVASSVSAHARARATLKRKPVAVLRWELKPDSLVKPHQERKQARPAIRHGIVEDRWLSGWLLAGALLVGSGLVALGVTAYEHDRELARPAVAQSSE